MIEKLLNVQTDFTGGQINEGAKRVQDKIVLSGGLAMSNFRQEAQGTAVSRPGRGALYPTGNRTETFRMSGSVTVQVSFVAGGLNITDLLGNVVASYFGALAVWTAANVGQISICQALRNIVICFPGNQPLLCSWTTSSNKWSIEPFTFDDSTGISQEPFYRLNVPGATMSWSAATANYKTVGDSITLTCSEGYFTSAMVGGLLSILGGQVQITAVGGGAQPVATATAKVLSAIPDSVALTPASLAPFLAGQIAETTSTDYEFEVFSIAGGALNGPLMNNILFTADTFTGTDGVSSDLGATTYVDTGLALFQGVTGTVQWSEEFMSAINGWPSACFYDKGRLGFCGFPQMPEAILWGAIGLNQVFYIDAAAAGSNISAGASASSAILEFIDNKPAVQNVVGWSGDEFAFTDRGIYQIPIGTSNPLKPGSVAFLQFSDDGVSPIRPLSTLDTIVYINLGLTRVSVVRATGSLTRPYISDDISELHSDLMVDPVCIAIQTGDGPDPERYIYVATADGAGIQGRFTPKRQIVGWVPIVSTGLIKWITSIGGVVWYNVAYGATTLLETENTTWNADGSVLVNAPPAAMVSAGKGPLWWLAGSTATLTDNGVTPANPQGLCFDVGDRSIDANGNIVPLQGDELWSALANTLLLTTSDLVPFNVALSFSSSAAVLAYFGAGTVATLAAQYYAGGGTSTLIIIRFPQFGGNARVIGASLGSMTLTQLKAINGTLSVTADGQLFSASINLSAVTSFAKAATALENALNATLPVVGVCPASSIAPVSVPVVGYVSGSTLYVTKNPGYLYPGAAMSGGGLASLQQIENQLTPLLPGEAMGGVGRYALTIGEPAGIASTTFTATYGILTLGSFSSGQAGVGVTVEGTTPFNSSVSQGGAIIYANLDPAAGNSSLSWMVDQTQTVSSTTLTLIGTPVHFTYGAQSPNGFAVQGCNLGASYGAAHTMSFASGTAAAALGLTQAAGAILSSPGQVAPSPAAFMDYCVALAPNWTGFQLIGVIDSPGFIPVQSNAFQAWAAATGVYTYLGQNATNMLAEAGSVEPIAGPLSSPTLQAGSPIVSAFTPIIPSAAEGASQHQRLRRRKISRAMVRVNTNAEFNWGGRDCSPYQFGDDATQAAPLRESNFLHRQMGRSYDPQVTLLKSRPGFLRLMECVTEVTI